ncbi:photoactive yellow protein [Pseudoduganella flava]|uniref:Photoactive yellow protein n=1 Tax=Pseudoduganella flava TaxID=871742 RepID=A0A562Q489_9BURK|nr:phosphonate transporter [Pseudoduganella flava]QGZ41558.1 phosphonate transporter [Pseudoduganella flava]TWI51534.1 photoactive yellow protein [Pseudoduganella flava]
MDALAFDQPDLGQRLAALSDEQIDDAPFGIIGFDETTAVRRYNRFEAQAAGLSPVSVLGQPFFTSVAPCMNNFMVAQRFEDALADGSGLDDTIPYVLTLRMRPTKVKLRLLALPGTALRYVLVQRQS